MLKEKSHGLLMCAVNLAIEIVTIKPEAKTIFMDQVDSLMRMLKEISGQYSSEYDVDGVNDPFLQVSILKFLELVACEGDLKEDFSSILATLTVNLPQRTNVGSGNNISSNAVNCILYEAVKIIMSIDAAKTLKKVGIGILGGFLGYKDVNSKYISLKSLLAASSLHKKSVQNHLNIILECLKEDDLSLRRMTLDILKIISEEQHMTTITNNLFNDMLTTKPEFLEDMTPSVCYIIEKHAPSKIWYFKSMLRVLVIAGNHVNEEAINNLLNMLSNTPDIQAYALYKLYLALCENQEQEGLAKTIFWLMGEHPSKSLFANIFFDYLLIFLAILIKGYDSNTQKDFPRISSNNILNLIENILNGKVGSLTKQMGMNCLAKLFAAINNIEDKNRIRKIIDDHKNSPNYEA
jgi:Adaptin N terminal region/Adaptin C-terminal domain